MPQIDVACAQLTWARGTPKEQVFAEISKAGYVGVPTGPYWVAPTPAEALEMLSRFSLRPAPGYFTGDWWVQDKHDEILVQAKSQAEFARAVGLSEIYIAAGGFEHFKTPNGKTRKEQVTNIGSSDGLDLDQYRRLAETLNEFGRITLEHGVRSCFHNHVGSVIETLEECERLLEMTDPNLVFLGPDTGHLAWAGIDVVAFCTRHARRIKTLHLKDIAFEVRDRGRGEHWGYEDFTKHGVFVELGEGNVDFPGLLKLLAQHDFGGWLVVETDVTQKPTALESATISRNYLKTLGL